MKFHFAEVPRSLVSKEPCWYVDVCMLIKLNAKLFGHLFKV